MQLGLVVLGIAIVSGVAMIAVSLWPRRSSVTDEESERMLRAAARARGSRR